MRKAIILLAVLSSSPIPAQAAASDCPGARTAYEQAVSDLSFALRRYTRCLANSEGTDDCSTEFRRLRSIQSDYEDAIRMLALYCD